MRLVIFKIIAKLAAMVFPDKTRSDIILNVCNDQVILHKRHLEMLSTIRPRTETHEWHTSDASNRRWYTDYDERNEFRKPDSKPGLYSF